MSTFQSDASAQGRQFDELARNVLRWHGFTVNDVPFVVPELGIEVDAEAVTGTRKFWCEFKGSWRGNRPGLMRTDSVKKALCDALLLWADEVDHPPMLLLTTHSPKADSRGATMLAVAHALGAVVGVFNVNDPDDVARLALLAKE